MKELQNNRSPITVEGELQSFDEAELAAHGLAGFAVAGIVYDPLRDATRHGVYAKGMIDYLVARYGEEHVRQISISQTALKELDTRLEQGNTALLVRVPEDPKTAVAPAA